MWDAHGWALRAIPERLIHRGVILVAPCKNGVHDLASACLRSPSKAWGGSCGRDDVLGERMATRARVREAGSIVSDVQERGREAVEAVGQVRDNLQEGIDKSPKTRPYTTLLLAVGFGFVLGALWAR